MKVYQDLLAMRSSDVEAYLKKRRPHVPSALQDSMTIVVLGVLDYPADVLSEEQFFFSCTRFKKDSLEICAANQGITLPIPQNGKVDSVVIAWFSDEQSAIRAAFSMQQRSIFSQIPRINRVGLVDAVFSVGMDEHRAFRLMRVSGKNQVVIDPVIWERVDPAVRSFLSLANNHPPDSNMRKDETKKIVDAIIKDLPFEQIVASLKQEALAKRPQKKLAKTR